jgi:hypothetical protein
MPTGREANTIWRFVAGVGFGNGIEIHVSIGKSIPSVKLRTNEYIFVGFS